MMLYADERRHRSGKLAQELDRESHNVLSEVRPYDLTDDLTRAERGHAEVIARALVWLHGVVPCGSAAASPAYA